MEERTIARHVSVVDPRWFDSRTVDVLGVGAVGLTVALMLGKLGIANLRVVDYDSVEPENLGPSLYGWPQVDTEHPKAKVMAAAEIISRDTRRSVGMCAGSVFDLKSYGDVAFLCLDSNNTKKQLVERMLGATRPPTWLFEGRMSERHLMVHSFDPSNELHVDAWRHYTPSDEEVDQSRGCGGERVSIGSVAFMAASLLEQLFIDYLQAHAEKPAGLVNQVYVDLVTYDMQSARWD